MTPFLRSQGARSPVGKTDGIRLAPLRGTSQVLRTPEGGGCFSALRNQSTNLPFVGILNLFIVDNEYNSAKDLVLVMKLRGSFSPSLYKATLGFFVFLFFFW